MASGIKSTIDGAGRIVIPKRIRDRLGLGGGAPVTIAEHDGVVEIRPSHLDVTLVRKGSVTVFEPTVQLPPIDADDVRSTVERLREE